MGLSYSLGRPVRPAFGVGSNRVGGGRGGRHGPAAALFSLSSSLCRTRVRVRASFLRVASDERARQEVPRGRFDLASLRGPEVRGARLRDPGSAPLAMTALRCCDETMFPRT